MKVKIVVDNPKDFKDMKEILESAICNYAKWVEGKEPLKYNIGEACVEAELHFKKKGE